MLKFDLTREHDLKNKNEKIEVVTHNDIISIERVTVLKYAHPGPAVVYHVSFLIFIYPSKKFVA